jgi:hypothetical protein
VGLCGVSFGAIRSIGHTVQAAIALLSSDLLGEFAAELMLPLQPHQLKLLCRNIVAGNSVAFELHSRPMTPASRNEILFNAWSRAVHTQYDSPQREDLDEWVVHTFHHPSAREFQDLQREKGDWLLYQILFIQWGATMRFDHVDAFHLAQPDLALALLQEKYRLPAAALESRKEGRRNLPLSDWDEPLFRRLNLTIEARHSEEIIDAFGYIREPAELNLTRAFWRVLLPLLDPDSESIVHGMARDLAREFAWPKNRPVPGPSSLKLSNLYLAAERLRGQTQSD